MRSLRHPEIRAQLSNSTARIPVDLVRCLSVGGERSSPGGIAENGGSTGFTLHARLDLPSTLLSPIGFGYPRGVIGPEIRSALGILAGATAAVLLFSASESYPQGQALQPLLEEQALIEALQEGGLVILIRHMSTDSFVPGEGTHDDRDCASQRNLNERGKQEARDVGAAFKILGIPVGTVLTSPYCRCVDTGKLAFGKGTPSEDLAVFDELSGPEKETRGKLIRKLLNTVPADERNTVLITHTGTLLYSFGLQTRPEGIAHIFRPAEFGNAIYLGRVTPEQWSALAASMGAGS